MHGDPVIMQKTVIEYASKADKEANKFKPRSQWIEDVEHTVEFSILGKKSFWMESRARAIAERENQTDLILKEKLKIKARVATTGDICTRTVAPKAAAPKRKEKFSQNFKERFVERLMPDD